MVVPKGTPNNFLEAPGDYTTTRTVHTDTYDAISPLKLDLSGRAVFITGASKGIGKETGLAYARAGASYIAVGARSSLSSSIAHLKQAAKDAGRAEPKVLTLKLDVTDMTSVQAAADQIEQEFGRLDIVVNNAGTCPDLEIITDSNPDSWWRTWEVNVRGPYLVIRTCLPLLLKTSDSLKTLVTLSSVGALIRFPGASSYPTSKLAVLRLTECLALEYGDQGIIAYTVHPGCIRTELSYDAGKMTPLAETLFIDTIPLPADTITYLTAEKREWLSGRYISCIWDMPELLARKDDIVKGDKLRVKFDPLAPV